MAPRRRGASLARNRGREGLFQAGRPQKQNPPPRAGAEKRVRPGSDAAAGALALTFQVREEEAAVALEVADAHVEHVHRVLNVELDAGLTRGLHADEALVEALREQA